MFEIRRYVTASGQDVFGRWMAGLNDNRARARVRMRLARLLSGNFGDCKPVGQGVYELRIDYGPGYRVYLARIGKAVVLLLGGGTKATQSADIARAIASLNDDQRRTL